MYLPRLFAEKVVAQQKNIARIVFTRDVLQELIVVWKDRAISRTPKTVGFPLIKAESRELVLFKCEHIADVKDIVETEKRTSGVEVVKRISIKMR